MYKLDLEKVEELEIRLPTSIGSQKKQESSRKTFASEAFDWVDHNKLEILQDMGIPGHLTYLLRNTCMQVKKQQLEADTERRTGSKSGKEYVKAVYCHPACLTYIQNTSREMLGQMKHKLESRLPEAISITSAMQMTPPTLWQKLKKI